MAGALDCIIFQSLSNPNIAVVALPPFLVTYFSLALQLLDLNWYFSIFNRAGALGKHCHTAVPIYAGLRTIERIYSLQMKQIPSLL